MVHVTFSFTCRMSLQIIVLFTVIASDEILYSLTIVFNAVNIGKYNACYMLFFSLV